MKSRSAAAVALASGAILSGGPAQASHPGPSAPIDEPSTVISTAHLREMKRYSWDAENVGDRETTISRAQAMALVNRTGSPWRVTEAALTRVTTLDTGTVFFDRTTGAWSVHPAVDHRLMWMIVSEATIKAVDDPASLGGPVRLTPDPRDITKVDALTGDVILPEYVRHPRPLLTWRLVGVALVDPATGDEPVAMSL